MKQIRNEFDLVGKTITNVKTIHREENGNSNEITVLIFSDGSFAGLAADWGSPYEGRRDYYVSLDNEISEKLDNI